MSARDGRRGSGDEGWCALRAPPSDRGWKPLPQGQATGYRLQSAVYGSPSPVTRHPSAAMWERHLAATVCGGRDGRQEAGDEGRCALRAPPSDRGWKPLPQGQATGYRLQSAVYGPPSPVTRLPSAAMWERHLAATVCGGRDGRQEAGGEGWCALRARPLRSFPSPVTRLPQTPTNVGRETGVERRGSVRAPRAALCLSRLP